MLHELLFVLSGYPGDVFMPMPSDTPPYNTFAIANNMTGLLHPTERDALNRLGHLGWIYHQLDTYMTATLTTSISNDSNNNNSSSSVYHRAYATCLGTVLADYRAVLMDMETRLVTKQDHVGSTVPLSLITSTLSRWALLLPSLHRLTLQIQTVPADKVLDLLIAQSKTGIPELHQAITTMVRHLHTLFYRQVTAWIMYGQLPTTHGFFIDTDTTTTTNSSSRKNTQWHRHYRLCLSRFPSHLPATMADSIFYIGKVMATLTKQHQLVIPSEMKQHHLTLLRTLMGYHASNDHSNDDSNDDDNDDDASLSLTHHTRHAAAIIHQIRRSTTSWLFSHVFQHQHTLTTYFASFRDVFLLGDGELWMQWLDLIQSRSTTRTNQIMMLGTTTTTKQQPREWMAMLVNASIGTVSEDRLDGYTFASSSGKASPFLSLLHNHHHNNDDDDDDDDASSSMFKCLTYTLQWPIDLFLDTSDIQRYADLWAMLMAVKKVQLALTHTTSGGDQRAVWRLRSHMLFWIDTLWSHVQGHVVSRHYDQLVMACSDTTVDFDQVQTAHQKYLDELMRGCLMTVAGPLAALLHTCLMFCHAAAAAAAAGGDGDDDDDDDVMDWWSPLEEAFVHDTDYLFGLLSNQHQEMKLSGHLNELLMRLDYNQWYSTQRYQHIPDLPAI
ncbi:gamma-tubulin complex component protein [Absidia repens]|uniref:Spindle pole body component n=1 Tax=Absidia repens TaxID=90262 RepID=A0A1X2HZV5_9FUNG|nr:gamma-tubulin complex component protein [Absidia repens]